ncbi:MAG: class I SAM-dependent methyltransferase [Thermoplasmata archaeon]|uniref:Class I SAM-dependent methyltransferase n=1 Tax=Candidatus Sysuiplasma superficiale TaxID=2823368 RepID=A0A8J8CHV4_9ARCH|nr:class I SAM-dependent methyltransferase [Candidatus Sysuiplasma superficiale]MBX8644333.1 class I SAM-dependent methyltransferase [Candidatus Sysuiplasma superficiale]MCL4347087.1 class I SAM-dependent methyltransferase [Candidatus Thermoplasmatota archaeon]MCL5437539.1 class I SAM-dependent methyltransferase [Candidatus Thermoplasmatota archaeon]
MPSDAEGRPHDRHPPPALMDIGLRRLFERPERFDRFIHRGATVADIGCGPGYYTIHFSDVVGDEGKVYATDTNLSALRILEKKIRMKGIRNVVWSNSTASDLTPIPDRSVDFLLSNLVMCCMSDHWGAVSEIRRVLKPDGVAYLSVSSLGRRKDSRHVGKKEWGRLLDAFAVKEEGKRFGARWALVSLQLQSTESGQKV